MKSDYLVWLAVIVGKEAHTIERFIESFSTAVDGISFVMATGNAEIDRSDELIKAKCRELELPFTISYYTNRTPLPHIDDFGAARQLSWEDAVKSGARYIMWADCDDTLAEGVGSIIRAAAESGEKDMYLMPYHVRGKSQIVTRERMVRNDGSSSWQYPIHEQLKFSRTMTYQILTDAIFVHSPTEGKSNSKERNLTILESQVADTARYYFYLQQEHFQANDPRFKTFARAALNAPGLGDIERYEVLLNMAQKERGMRARVYASQAFDLMPDRREALALLASYAIVDQDHERAHQFARIMMGIKKPAKTYWSLQQDWYDWKGLQLYCQTLRLLGKVEEANEFEDRFYIESGMIFSIVHATLGRPDQALAMREAWLSRADNPLNVEYLFGLHDFDQKSFKYLRGFRHSVTSKKGAGPNLEAAAAISRGRIIIQAQDDIVPPEHWDTLLLQKLAYTPLDHPCFWCVSDGHRKDRVHVTSIMTRAYMEMKAAGDCEGCGFGHPGYFSMYWDTENSYRAYKDAQDRKIRLIDATDMIFYHDHPAFTQKPWDETYKIENAPEHYEEGKKLFLERNPEAATDGIIQF